MGRTFQSVTLMTIVMLGVATHSFGQGAAPWFVIELLWSPRLVADLEEIRTFTTVGDLLKWEQNLVDARVGGRAVLDEMQVSERLNDGTATNYGFGVAVDKYRGLRTVGHGGADAGYRADVVRFPDQDLAIAALCNLSTIAPGVLTRKAAEIILGPDLFTPPAPSIAVGQTEIAALAGTYWNPITDDVLRIAVKDGQLMSGTNVLAPLGGSRFRVGEQETTFVFPPSTTGTNSILGRWTWSKLDTFSGFGTVTFARAPSGDVTGFTVSTGRVRRL